MAKKRKTRTYQKRGRYYGDFRDLGGSLEALIPHGSRQATTDLDEANDIVARRVRELTEIRDRAAIGIIPDPADARRRYLKAFAAEHLVEKARAGEVTDGWLALMEQRLKEAVAFFGAERDLESITPKDVKAWATWLGKRPGRGGKSLSPASVRAYLNALSNLYTRALADDLVTANPVAKMIDKPSKRRTAEANFLDVPEVALLLEAARLYRPEREGITIPYGYELLATLFLTGCRWSEARALLSSDISFDRSIIFIRENEHRRLKTPGSRRVVPLHPQLRQILQDYVARTPPAQLLFPAIKGQKEQPVGDIRKYLDALAKRLGWEPGTLRTRIARHSYTAARLQTVQHGKPISPYVVSRELGHKSMEMILEVYAHLGDFAPRGEHVEYRVDQHRDVLGERLRKLEV